MRSSQNEHWITTSNSSISCFGKCFHVSHGVFRKVLNRELFFEPSKLFYANFARVPSEIFFLKKFLLGAFSHRNIFAREIYKNDISWNINDPVLHVDSFYIDGKNAKRRTLIIDLPTWIRSVSQQLRVALKVLDLISFISTSGEALAGSVTRRDDPNCQRKGQKMTREKFFWKENEMFRKKGRWTTWKETEIMLWQTKENVMNLWKIDEERHENVRKGK